MDLIADCYFDLAASIEMVVDFLSMKNSASVNTCFRLLHPPGDIHNYLFDFCSDFATRVFPCVVIVVVLYVVID